MAPAEPFASRSLRYPHRNRLEARPGSGPPAPEAMPAPPGVSPTLRGTGVALLPKIPSLHHTVFLAPQPTDALPS